MMRKPIAANSGLQHIFKAVYLAQPVVVAQFKQAREKTFSFPGSHELLPLPHVLLQEILPSQLCLPLRLRQDFLTCSRWNKYDCEWLKGTCIKPLKLVFRTCLLQVGIFSRLHMRLWGPSSATVAPGHVFHYCRASLWSETQ